MRKVTFAAALLASLALPAAAQTAEDAIVVTATRTPTPILSLPADVTVIDTDAARLEGATSLAQALATNPGLTVVPLGGVGQQTSLFSGGTNSEHTLVLFDGLRINDAAAPKGAFDAGQDLLGDLGSIEIVEGPMSALYGSDAIGGVINMLARHGGEGALNARMDLAAGSFDTVSATAGVDGTLGAFRYAVTAEGYSTEGYDLVPSRMSTHTGEDDGAEMATYTGVFDLALTDAFALDLLLRRRTASADFDKLAFIGFDEVRIEDNDLEMFKNDMDLARLGATWRASDTLSLRATYGGVDTDRAQNDSGAIDFAYQAERRFGDVTLDWTPGEIGAFTDVALVAGISGEQEEVNIYELFDPSFPPASIVIAERDHQSAFASAQGTIGRVTLTGAVRADEFEAFDTHTTWRVGASFAVTDSARLYAAYGTGFRAPTLYERFVSFGDPNLKPEESDSWEVGGDVHFAAFGQDNGLELGALYRSTDIEGMINFGPSFGYENIDKAEVRTAEARIGVRPTSWLTARVSYVYTDATDATDGSQLLRRPENGWNASLAVANGPFRATLAWLQVGERSDISYDNDGVNIGVGDVPSYDVVRASASYEFQPGIQAYVSADNLFDEEYEPANAFAGAPRSVMAGIRLRTGQ